MSCREEREYDYTADVELSIQRVRDAFNAPDARAGNIADTISELEGVEIDLGDLNSKLGALVDAVCEVTSALESIVAEEAFADIQLQSDVSVALDELLG